MAEIFFVVPGEPMGQKRHRSSIVEGKIHNFDPSGAQKSDFKWMAFNSRPKEPHAGPVSLDIVFYFQRPLKHYGTGRNSHRLKEDAPIWHIGKPDMDNCLKFVMDALNKVYWRDDSIICHAVLDKKYSAEPRIEVKVNLL